MGIDKTKAQRRQELKAQARRIGTVMILGVLIVASMYLYDWMSTSPRFAVTEVDFDGLARVDDRDVSAMLADLRGQNIFLAPLESFRARLADHPRIASVSLRRVLPGRITCSVLEREPVALLYTDRFLEVDATGVIMAEDEFTSMLDLPIITGVPFQLARAGRRCDSPELKRALDALSTCKSVGGDFAGDISEVKVAAGNVSIRSLRKDCVIMLGDGDYARRLKKYLMLKETIGARNYSPRLIDLRYDDQVVLRGQI